MRKLLAAVFVVGLVVATGARIETAKADWFDFQSIVDMLTQIGSGDLSASQSASISQTP
jgi:hypothetical protein